MNRRDLIRALLGCAGSAAAAKLMPVPTEQAALPAFPPSTTGYMKVETESFTTSGNVNIGEWQVMHWTCTETV